ncbi:MAG: IS66 family transposase, partial [Treponema sp.]|nr:IS66 family transposase [Treponema sp.]
MHEFIDGFIGYLQTDGYPGYDCALKSYQGIIHVGCFGYARCTFFEAEKVGSQSRSAAIALGYIRQLYRIEKELREEELPVEDFLKQRKDKARVVLTAFKKWLTQRAADVNPELLLGKAIGYTL